LRPDAYTGEYAESCNLLPIGLISEGVQAAGFALYIYEGVLISSRGSAMLTKRSRSARGTIELGELLMQWTAPAFEEVCLNCEINSYASAKL
jgi:coenzyme PQQ precursor peptide PqqA